ncbi:MAG: hypothetical protein FJ263_09645 [Planctomycetes bacterium]|nr:hypothetical protein [Planctomycetota bacterium]
MEYPALINPASTGWSQSQKNRKNQETERSKKKEAELSFLELVKKRYSVRNYKDSPVPKEMLNRCIEAARLAPSACNSQPWKYVIIDDPDLRDKMAKAAFEGILKFNHFAFKAPVLVLIVSERQKLSAQFGSIVKGKNFSQMDIGITVEWEGNIVSP